MRPNAELRLFALPLCAVLVDAVTKGLSKSWNATQLFTARHNIGPRCRPVAHD